MTNEQKRDLCLALMRADSEAEVVRVLTDAGFWDNRRVWRLYGDRENNFRYDWQPAKPTRCGAR